MSASSPPPFIGVISDTHGLLRPEALSALQGALAILHAGDIGAASVIEELERIAPVHAIRGNVDRGEWARRFPATRDVEIEGLRFHLLHDVKSLDPQALAKGVHAVISGHSHKPSIGREQGVLFFNPGSAGPRRFRLPVCVGRLPLDGEELEAEIVELDI